MNYLFSPLQIKNTTLKNRMVVSPMCMYSCVDGMANDFHLVHYGSRAIGGFGLIVIEATGVSPEGRITYGDMGIWSDKHIEKQKQLVSFCQNQGAKMAIQLAHAGRKASHQLPQDGAKQILPDAPNGWQTVSASALAFEEGEVAPFALDLAGIQKIKNDFVEAAKRCEKIGYDILEIHAAHGYLFHQFYSPLSNQRTDEYGGSFENRIRLLLEVVTLVRQVWQQKPLFVRISATDWTEGGWTLEDSILLSKHLQTIGVDLIDTSSGGNVPKASIYSYAGYQAAFAGEIREKAQIKTGAVGKITTAALSETLLQEQKADLIFYGREALRQPYFPLQAAREIEEQIPIPIPYWRAWK